MHEQCNSIYSLLRLKQIFPSQLNLTCMESLGDVGIGNHEALNHNPLLGWPSAQAGCYQMLIPKAEFSPLNCASFNTTFTTQVAVIIFTVVHFIYVVIKFSTKRIRLALCWSCLNNLSYSAWHIVTLVVWTLSICALVHFYSELTGINTCGYITTRWQQKHPRIKTVELRSLGFLFL